MICLGSTCAQGHAECKSRALCRAMHAKIARPEQTEEQDKPVITPHEPFTWLEIGLVVFICAGIFGLLLAFNPALVRWAFL